MCKMNTVASVFVGGEMRIRGVKKRSVSLKTQEGFNKIEKVENSTFRLRM